MLEELNPALAAQSMVRRVAASQAVFRAGGYSAEGAFYEYATRIMSRHVTATVGAVDAGGLSSLTGPQQAALARLPELFDAFRGNRIDVLARRAILSDERLSPLFDSGRLRSMYRSGPDFLEPATGRWWDMTTLGQWTGHADQYGPGGLPLYTL
jgi:hypothetical protein